MVRLCILQTTIWSCFISEKYFLQRSKLYLDQPLFQNKIHVWWLTDNGIKKKSFPFLPFKWRTWHCTCTLQHYIYSLTWYSNSSLYKQEPLLVSVLCLVFVKYLATKESKQPETVVDGDVVEYLDVSVLSGQSDRRYIAFPHLWLLFLCSKRLIVGFLAFLGFFYTFFL